MQVTVDGMVWLLRSEMEPSRIEEMKRQLTVTPRKYDFGDEDAEVAPIQMYAETPSSFGVPRSWFFSKVKQDHVYTWATSDGSPIKLESCIRFDGPYKEQGDVVKQLIFNFDQFTSFNEDIKRGRSLGQIFQGKTGFGKTNVALAVIAELGRTAIVFVHKEFLLKQWAERIAEFLPGARVGIVREDVCDFEGKDIVIAMVQSLFQDDGTRYPRALYTWPGVMVVDEVHRIGAPTWSQLPKRFPATFRLGLSATPRRKDGADVVFWNHIGPITTKAQTEMPVPAVRMLPFKPRGKWDKYVEREDAKNPIVINIIVRSQERNRVILTELRKMLSAPSARKVMVLSHRLEHLRTLRESMKTFPGMPDVTADYYVGDWFTGEKVLPLKRGMWNMADGGREEAIKKLYTSISRRKTADGAGGGRIVVAKDLDEAERTKWFVQKGMEGVAEPPPLDPKLKLHFVTIDTDTFNAVMGSYNIGDVIEVLLEVLSNDQLFHLAQVAQVAQRMTEKRRRRTDEELHEAERARVVFATYQMCAEGIDLPAIDTILFATPSGDVEQAIGRGRRFCIPKRHGGMIKPERCEHLCPWRAATCEGKPRIVVADIFDVGIAMTARAERGRRRYYKSNSFKVVG